MAASGVSAPPRSVRRATTAILVIAAIHVLALVLLIVNRHALVVSAADQHPEWTAERVQDLADSRLLESGIPHVILPILFLFRALAVRSARSRRRGGLTGLLVLQLLAHATLPLQARMLPTFVGWLVLVQGFSLVFEVAAFWLLWGPAESRAWFRGAALDRATW